ncbi:MAG: hypothetical protein V7K24_14000 [Nostoc sp.]
MTNDPLGSPVAHEGNPQGRTGSQTTNDATCYKPGNPSKAMAYK